MEQQPTLPCLAGILASLVLSAGATSAMATQNVSCESLASLAMPATTLTIVQEVTGGSFTPPGSTTAITGLPAFCRYAGVVAPQINFEVWMPTQTWNGRLEAVGNGGLAGSISYSDLATGLLRGFTTVSTDTGHVSSDTTWLTNAQQLIDYGSRSIHEMTVRAKTLVKAYYQEPLRYSYFNGCSTGGGQALMSAQRYPDDFNGVLAGSSNWDQTKLRSGGHIWTWFALHETPQSNLSAAQRTLLTNAAIAKCDAQDGVKDGVVDDPRTCGFDPASLACQPNQDPNTCLSAPQIYAVNKIYAGSRNPRTGERIWPPYLPTSESGWGSHAGATPFGAATTFFRYAVFQNPTFDFLNFNFDTDTAKGEAFAPIVDATSPDLRAFRRHGAKLMMYHGFADPLISPVASINYYGSVVDFFGSKDEGEARGDGLEEVQEFARLFMIPGMGHCGGGPGTDTFDGIGTVQDWVERHVPPSRILASHLTNGVVDKTRPLCPWPERAVYTGTGSTNDAASFVCRVVEHDADGGDRDHGGSRD